MMYNTESQKLQIDIANDKVITIDHILQEMETSVLHILPMPEPLPPKLIVNISPGATLIYTNSSDVEVTVPSGVYTVDALGDLVLDSSAANLQ